jgi:hypothetical protein
VVHPKLQVDQVTVEHLQQHFVNFARNDNLGQISTWLLAQADALNPDSSECLQLAVLHSTAVDFPKTGKPAEINFELMRKLVSYLTAAAYATCTSWLRDVWLSPASVKAVCRRSVAQSGSH